MERQISEPVETYYSSDEQSASGSAARKDSRFQFPKKPSSELRKETMRKFNERSAAKRLPKLQHRSRQSDTSIDETGEPMSAPIVNEQKKSNLHRSQSSEPVTHSTRRDIYDQKQELRTALAKRTPAIRKARTMELQTENKIPKKGVRFQLPEKAASDGEEVELVQPKPMEKTKPVIDSKSNQLLKPLKEPASLKSPTLLSPNRMQESVYLPTVNSFDLGLKNIAETFGFQTGGGASQDKFEKNNLLPITSSADGTASTQSTLDNPFPLSPLQSFDNTMQKIKETLGFNDIKADKKAKDDQSDSAVLATSSTETDNSADAIAKDKGFYLPSLPNLESTIQTIRDTLRINSPKSSESASPTKGDSIAGDNINAVANSSTSASKKENTFQLPTISSFDNTIGAIKETFGIDQKEQATPGKSNRFVSVTQDQRDSQSEPSHDDENKEDELRLYGPTINETNVSTNTDAFDKNTVTAQSESRILVPKDNIGVLLPTLPNLDSTIQTIRETLGINSSKANDKVNFVQNNSMNSDRIITEMDSVPSATKKESAFQLPIIPSIDTAIDAIKETLGIDQKLQNKSKQNDQSQSSNLNSKSVQPSAPSSDKEQKSSFDFPIMKLFDSTLLRFKATLGLDKSSTKTRRGSVKTSTTDENSAAIQDESKMLVLKNETEDVQVSVFLIFDSAIRTIRETLRLKETKKDSNTNLTQADSSTSVTNDLVHDNMSLTAKAENAFLLLKIPLLDGTLQTIRGTFNLDQINQTESNNNNEDPDELTIPFFPSTMESIRDTGGLTETVTNQQFNDETSANQSTLNDMEFEGIFSILKQDSGFIQMRIPVLDGTWKTIKARLRINDLKEDEIDENIDDSDMVVISSFDSAMENMRELHGINDVAIKQELERGFSNFPVSQDDIQPESKSSTPKQDNGLLLMRIPLLDGTWKTIKATLNIDDMKEDETGKNEDSDEITIPFFPSTMESIRDTGGLSVTVMKDEPKKDPSDVPDFTNDKKNENISSTSKKGDRSFLSPVVSSLDGTLKTIKTTFNIDELKDGKIEAKIEDLDRITIPFYPSTMDSIKAIGGLSETVVLEESQPETSDSQNYEGGEFQVPLLDDAIRVIKDSAQTITQVEPSSFLMKKESGLRIPSVHIVSSTVHSIRGALRLTEPKRDTSAKSDTDDSLSTNTSVHAEEHATMPTASKTESLASRTIAPLNVTMRTIKSALGFRKRKRDKESQKSTHDSIHNEDPEGQCENMDSRLRDHDPEPITMATQAPPSETSSQSHNDNPVDSVDDPLNEGAPSDVDHPSIDFNSLVVYF